MIGMSSRSLHSLRLFLLPGLPVAALALVLDLRGGTLPILTNGSTVVLLGGVGVGLIIAWRFNQSRTAFALLVILAADRLWVHAFGSAGDFWLRAAAVSVVSTLPAVNITVASRLAERGVITRHGLTRFAILAGQAVLVLTLLRFTPRVFYRYMTAAPFPPILFGWTGMPQIAAVLLLLAVSVFTVAFLRTARAEDAGFFWALLLIEAPVLLPPAPRVFTVYAAAAAVVLVAYILESSHSMAFRDALTGLPGRRAFENELAKLGNRYALAVADIDYFKTFNDTYGHDVGDQVLRMVAGHLARVRSGGRAYRYGGEEFALLFPRRSAGEVEHAVEELRQRIDDARFTLRRRDRPDTRPKQSRTAAQSRHTALSVTVSVGVAERDGQRRSPLDVLKAADEALYEAKRGGRNRVARAP